MPLQADTNGRIVATLTIPAGLPAGTKRVAARGQGGTTAATSYTGSGIISTRILQRVFTTRTWRAAQAPVIDPAGNWDSGSFGGASDDPLAQTFMIPRDARGIGRHVTGIDVKFCAIGARANPVICQVREVELGVPGPVVVAESFRPMAGVVLNAWTAFDFWFPVFLRDDREYALVFLTDDGVHSLAIAGLGGFDVDQQRWVTSQPYTVGVLLSGANDRTWTAHQRDDLAFRMRAAKMTASSRVVDAGAVQLTNVTDMVVFAGTELPAVDTSIMVRLTRATGEVIRVRPGQPIKFTTRVTELVALAFELAGTVVHSPVLFPFVQFFRGEQSDTANYISRAMAAGADTRVVVTYEALLPGAAAVAVQAGQTGAMAAVPVSSQTALGDGWIERSHILTPYGAADARAELVLSGSPADRPQLRGLRVILTDQPINITG